MKQTAISCFRKLPESENPLTFLPGVNVMRMEVRNNRPCGIPSKQAEKVCYQFNKKLADGTLQLTPDQQQVIDERRAALRNNVDRLVQRGKDAERKAHKKSIEETIGTDRESLMRFYASLEIPPLDGKPFPGPERLTPNWAIYRWLQVNLLMGVDLLFCYKLILGDVMTEKLATQLENDILDSHYVIVGTLEGTLASGYRNVRPLWRLIRAKGELIPASLASR